MILPPITFDEKYTERDRKIYTFIVNSVVREYQKKLHPYAAFITHPIREIFFQPTPLTECGCHNAMGITFDSIDVIKLRAPTKIGFWDAQGYGVNVSHEIAHHILEEYFLDRRVGNNVVHWCVNVQKHIYTKTYTSPMFFKRYGLPYLKIAMFDLPKIIAEKNVIMASLVGTEKPSHPYW